MCLLVLALSGCQTSPPTRSHGGPVADHVSFVDELRRRGVTVEIAGGVQQPFLRGRGTLLRLAGGPLTAQAELQSYDYDSSTIAQADAERIRPDGNPQGFSVNWVAPPHFFRRERVIVLYLGTDRGALTLLTEILGPPFAGGGS